MKSFILANENQAKKVKKKKLHHLRLEKTLTEVTSDNVNSNSLSSISIISNSSFTSISPSLHSGNGISYDFFFFSLSGLSEVLRGERVKWVVLCSEIGTVWFSCLNFKIKKELGLLINNSNFLKSNAFNIFYFLFFIL